MPFKVNVNVNGCFLDYMTVNKPIILFLINCIHLRTMHCIDLNTANLYGCGKTALIILFIKKLLWVQYCYFSDENGKSL